MDSDKDFNTYNINLEDLEDTLTVSSISAPIQGTWIGPLQDPSNTDTITLSSIANGGVSLTSPYTFAGTIGTGFSNTTYSTSSAGTSTPWYTNSVSPKIKLEGEDADVEVNGWSLVSAVKRIEERLGLFQLNTELEAEWEELRTLGEQYRKLEQHIQDKQATWDRIKAMPAPEID